MKCRRASRKILSLTLRNLPPEPGLLVKLSLPSFPEFSTHPEPFPVRTAQQLRWIWR